MSARPALRTFVLAAALSAPTMAVAALVVAPTDVAGLIPRVDLGSEQTRSLETAEPWSDAWLAERAAAYLDDPAARRAALERSLQNPDNLYSRARLSAYGRQDFGWDLLPQWNPVTVAVDDVAVRDLAAGRAPVVPEGTAPLWDGQRPSTRQDWIDLGREVFFRYPLRPEVFAAHALADEKLATRIGLHRAPDGTRPGTVVFADIDGVDKVGITCALCHAAVDDEGLHPGRARRDFDYGAMRLAYHHDTGDAVDPELARRMATWGAGRADITEDDDEDPVAIPDLWSIAQLRTFTQAATIVHARPGQAPDPLALAIRQETQILHANRERTRPPRELSWALAMYVYSLEPTPVAERAHDATALRGRELFAAHCRRCHVDANGSGPAVKATQVGTDPALAEGTSRGTGRYRPSPLIRVADAAPYLHHGVVATLDDLLDPARLREDFTRGARGPGAIAGHAYGTDLPRSDRAALVAWLRTL